MDLTDIVGRVYQKIPRYPSRRAEKTSERTFDSFSVFRTFDIVCPGNQNGPLIARSAL